VNLISNLYRLPFSLSASLIAYYIQRILHLPYRKEHAQLNEYYQHLMSNNGYYERSTIESFTSKYTFNDNATQLITIRRRPSTDLTTFEQIFKRQEYAPVVDRLKKENTRNLKIVDAGANVGFTTLYFKNNFPDAEIISVEPDSGNFKMLSENVWNNSLNGVNLVQGAVWSSDRYLKILNDFRGGGEWARRVMEDENDSAVKSYTIKTLMQMFKWNHIDLLKLDVEGAEKKIFADKDKAADFLSVTKYLAMEIHDEFNCREDIYHILKLNNFSYFNQGELTIGISNNRKTGE
jgi:FkbM family methyltransferase